MYEYTNKNETRPYVTLVVQDNEHYYIQCALDKHVNLLPARMKFVGRYEYAACIVTVCCPTGCEVHPAVSKRVADHYVDTIHNVLATGNRYVCRLDFS